MPTRKRRSIIVAPAVLLSAVVAVLYTSGGFSLAQAPPGDIPVNVGLPERKLIIQRAGETLAAFTVEIADTPETQRIGLMGAHRAAPRSRHALRLGDAVPPRPCG